MEEIIKLESSRHQRWEQSYYLLDDHKLPKTLIIQGTGDEVCYRGNALFQRKALDLGYDCRMILYEGQPHGFLKWEESSDNKVYFNVIEKFENFINEVI